MNVFTKHNGQWLVSGPDVAVGATVTVSKRNGTQDQVTIDTILPDVLVNGHPLGTIKKAPRINAHPYKNQSGYGRRRRGYDPSVAPGVDAAIALMQEAADRIRRAASMPPAENEQKAFAEVAEALKHFRQQRATQQAVSA